LEIFPGKLSSQAFHEDIFSTLKDNDSRVYELITKEYERLQSTLQLIAAEGQCSRAVLAALGSVIQNKTTEGFPGSRYHGGCEIVDEVERLAAARAREAFSAKYANVQPHSGTGANQIILTAILEKGDKILSLGLDQGGHLSHGAKVSFSGKFFDIENYYVDEETFLLDYGAISRQAREVKPKLIICGASAYSRTIDFKKFREIADSVGAYLLADISHIAGLVMAGAHSSCVDYAHFTTTSTYKPGGPRGGLIVMGQDYENKIKVGGRDIALWEHIEKTTFPGMQGTPYLNNIAAKAVFFKEMLSEEYRARQFKIIENAKALASGLAGQKCLEECGIIVNKNRLPYDKKSAAVASGVRLGTPIVTKNGMGLAEMESISALVDVVLKEVKVKSDSEYEIDKSLRDEVRDKVKQLCGRFPMCY
jgi:glycine hydroxymethyltransferase